MNKKLVIIHVVAVLILIVIAATVYILANPKGDYKEGTYLGAAGSHTASVYVDKNGMIKSVLIDSAYLQYNTDGTCKYTKTSYSGKVECISTTKQILKEEYGMKVASPISKEWMEQANDLGAKIVEEQGTKWIKVNEDGSTDSISTVTVTVDEMVEAVNDALKQAE